MRPCVRVALAATLIGSAAVMPLPNLMPRAAAAAATSDLVGPAGSGRFGTRVLVLTNGNLVVVDDKFDGNGKTDIGAVYLFSGTTHALISALTGASDGDQVGSNGVYEVANSNFVVASPLWNRPGFGQQVGAATWVNGATGLNGAVSNANSFVGATEGDNIADEIAVLTNGNYVIVGDNYDRGSIINAGSVTWANGTTGIVGSPSFLKSLSGNTDFDSVGSYGVTPLANGNYTVESPDWTNGSEESAGAVTWGDGKFGGTHGDVTAFNSVVGTHANDRVGSGNTSATFGGVFPLTDGDYVISSPNWSNGVDPEVGAATFANGSGGTFGAVTIGNSLIGSQQSDRVSRQGIIALTNGNYVVASGEWDNGATFNVGAVTWGNGATGTSGLVSAANSLIGAHNNDAVGGADTVQIDGVTALTNGHYVVASPDWDNGLIEDAGAATWGNGENGSTKGILTAAVSLIGTTADDHVSGGGVTPLTNGNYVVASPDWNKGGIAHVGAVRWALANGTTVGAMSALNSLVGTAANDRVGGGGGGVVALPSGRYVVGSPLLDVGGNADAGASTLGKATSATVGQVGPANSLVGSHAGDRIGVSTFALPTSNYVTGSPSYTNGGATSAGAATFASGATGLVATVNASNSFVGGATSDVLGDGGVVVMPDSRFVVISRHLSHDGVVGAGAATVGGLAGGVGTPSAANSVFGTIVNGVSGAASRYLGDGSFVIQRPASNVVTLLSFQPDPNDPNDPGNPGNPGNPNNPADLDYVSVAPARLVDTRPGFATVDGPAAGSGLVAGGSTFEVLVTGRGGVPAAVPAVALNVTVTEAGAPGFLTAFPCGQPQPTASNLNFETGSTIPNAVVAKVGDGGKVCLFASQDVQLVVDANGYFPPTTSFVSMNPARLLETRQGPGNVTVDGQQQNGGVVAAASVTAVQVTGRAAIPDDAVAVALNVTVTQPDAPGFVTVFPCGGQPPTASNLNHVVGQTIPNLVIAKVGDGGRVCLFNQSTAHLIVDVGGYFPANTTYVPLNPARFLDTRQGSVTTDGQGSGAGVQPTGTVTVVHVGGRAEVPADAATAVLNVTVTEPVAPGFATVYPCGIDPPLASNVNFAVGQTIPNAVISKIGTNGDVCIFNSQPTHLIADINGYFP